MRFSKILTTAAVVGLVFFSGTSGRGEDAAAWAKAHQSELVELYRHFHTHPELSFEEYETGKQAFEYTWLAH